MPTTKLLVLAVFTTCSAGAFTGVFTVLWQFVVLVGQLASPPPITLAVLLNVVPLAEGCGVTGMTKATGVPVARFVAIVQVTVWPLAVHPLGSVPIVRLPGIVSVMVLVAVVAAVPMLVTVRV